MKYPNALIILHGSEPCIQVETSGQPETDNQIIQIRITGVGAAFETGSHAFESAESQPVTLRKNCDT